MLEGILDELRSKGMEKVATLLDPKFQLSLIYLEVLTHPRWENEVKEAIGTKSYKDLKLIYLAQGNNILSSLTEAPIYSDNFKIGKEHQESIVVKKTILSIDDFLDSREITTEIMKLNHQIKLAVYSKAEKIIGNDEDLMYDIFNDDDTYVKMQNDYNEEQKDSFFLKRLNSSFDRVKKVVEMNAPSEIVKMMVNSTQKFVNIKYNNFEEFVRKVEDIIKDKSLLENKIKEWKISLKDTQRERVLENAKAYFKYSEAEEIYLIGSRIDSLINYWADNMTEDNPNGDSFAHKIMYEDRFSEETIIKSFNEILKSDLNLRAKIIEDYEREITSLFNDLTGYEQILNGGIVTNPNISKYSIMQNHARIPNLEYSEKLLESLNPRVKKLRELLDKLPEISDIAVSSRIRKQTELTYQMRELPKNPLDVTIGNDGKACVFVPNKVEDLKNGWSIPSYQKHNKVRIFGLYRKRAKAENRMGFVLGFDSSYKNEEVLVCNSLEISRFGIAGGREVITKVTEYVENWLMDYAKLNGYDGVAMGNHSYNTSKNYTSNDKEIVQGFVIFEKNGIPIHSDVFKIKNTVDIFTKEQLMISRPNSLYWIMKPK